MFTNQEAYLIKTIIESLRGVSADTSAIEKALSIVLDFEKLTIDERDEVTIKIQK